MKVIQSYIYNIYNKIIIYIYNFPSTKLYDSGSRMVQEIRKERVR